MDMGDFYCCIIKRKMKNAFSSLSLILISAMFGFVAIGNAHAFGISVADQEPEVVLLCDQGACTEGYTFTLDSSQKLCGRFKCVTQVQMFEDHFEIIKGSIGEEPKGIYSVSRGFLCEDKFDGPHCVLVSQIEEVPDRELLHARVSSWIEIEKNLKQTALVVDSVAVFFNVVMIAVFVLLPWKKVLKRYREKVANKTRRFIAGQFLLFLFYFVINGFFSFLGIGSVLNESVFVISTGFSLGIATISLVAAVIFTIFLKLSKKNNITK